MRRWLFMLPGVLFALLIAGFYVGIEVHSDVLPSALINKPAPQFSLPPLIAGQPGFSTADLKGHVSLVNAFASWCAPCRDEAPALSALARSGVPIYGIDYKDKPAVARAWVTALGDPYRRIGADSGDVAIDWGVYGVPETFLVDRSGRIRYKHVGPLSEADVAKTILPLVARLEK
ncbi:MAG TPA: DsbE family thiol:disulfide interchange protein [Stellaceae bacterium]|nr:DsbE family thiol:disulfide interchange protein [Stellaceae bacterium]